VKLSMNPYDLEDVKTQIRQLRATKLQQQQERDLLENETSTLQAKLESIKQQLNIETVTDELRFVGSDVFNDPINDDTHPDDDHIDVKRFKMLNEKLEKQILNQEIRQNLAKLESMALHSEKLLRDAQKVLKRNEKEKALFPPFYFSTPSEIEEKIGNLVSYV